MAGGKDTWIHISALLQQLTQITRVKAIFAVDLGRQFRNGIGRAAATLISDLNFSGNKAKLFFLGEGAILGRQEERMGYIYDGRFIK